MNLFIAIAHAATVNLNIPGSSVPSADIPGIIRNIYDFALLAAGILAFGAIVWGGIRYATGKGNPSSETEGKSWITNALLGLLLLVGAYIILYTINPQLVSLQIMGVTALSGTSAGPGAGAGTGPGTGATGCASGSCQSLSGGGFACKPASQQPGGVNSCSAAQGMVDTLKCLQQNGAPGITITEAMPPTVRHTSLCHNNGCCVDIQVNSGNCSDVQAIKRAAQNCNTSVLNEYTGCGGTRYDTTTGDNVHIRSAPGGGC